MEGRKSALAPCSAPFIVGLGFNIKMLQAYLVSPRSFCLRLPDWDASYRGGLACGAPGVGGGSCCSGGGPARDSRSHPGLAAPLRRIQPDQLGVELALGYNGIERLTGMLHGAGARGDRRLDGWLEQARAMASRGAAGPGLAARVGERRGQAAGSRRGASVGTAGRATLRLLNAQLGSQVSWLLPLALLGLLATGWGDPLARTLRPAALVVAAKQRRDDWGDD